MRPILIIVFILLSNLVLSQNQKKIDSLRGLLIKAPDSSKFKIYNSLFKRLIRTRPDEAKMYLDSMQSNEANKNNHAQFGQVLINKGFYNRRIANYKETEAYYLQALEIFEVLKDKKKISEVLLKLGVVQRHLGKFEEAMNNYMKSLRINEEIGKKGTSIASVYTSIGVLHGTLKNYELSTEYLLKAEAIYLELNRKNRLATVWNNLGHIYKRLKLFNKAIEYYNKSVAHNATIKNYSSLVRSYNAIGELYSTQDDTDKANQNYLKSYTLMDSIKEPYLKGLILSALGRLQLKKNDYNKALGYFKSALLYSKESNEDEKTTKNLYNISKAYAGLGNFKEAYNYSDLHFNEYSSTFKKESADKINELEIKYQTEKKEAALALQEEEINTLNEKAKVDKLTKGLYAGGTFSGIALSGLLFFGFRQRIKKNKIAREKQEVIYKQEIAHKKKELTSQTLHLVQKNTFIQELMDNLENVKNSPEKFKTEFRRIVMLLKKENASDKDWEVFKTYFAEVHNDFDQKLKTLYADISEKEIRLAAFLRMNLTTKEIAATLNVLPDSILKSKYRLKKKLNLDKEIDLTSFLNTL